MRQKRDKKAGQVGEEVNRRVKKGFLGGVERQNRHARALAEGESRALAVQPAASLVAQKAAIAAGMTSGWGFFWTGLQKAEQAASGSVRRIGTKEIDAPRRAATGSLVLDDVFLAGERRTAIQQNNKNNAKNKKGDEKEQRTAKGAKEGTTSEHGEITRAARQNGEYPLLRALETANTTALSALPGAAVTMARSTEWRGRTPGRALSERSTLWSASGTGNAGTARDGQRQAIHRQRIGGDLAGALVRGKAAAFLPRMPLRKMERRQEQQVALGLPTREGTRREERGLSAGWFRDKSDAASSTKRAATGMTEWSQVLGRRMNGGQTMQLAVPSTRRVAAASGWTQKKTQDGTTRMHGTEQVGRTAAVMMDVVARSAMQERIWETATVKNGGVKVGGLATRTTRAAGRMALPNAQNARRTEWTLPLPQINASNEGNWLGEIRRQNGRKTMGAERGWEWHNHIAISGNEFHTAAIDPDELADQLGRRIATEIENSASAGFGY